MHFPRKMPPAAPPPQHVFVLVEAQHVSVWYGGVSSLVIARSSPSAMQLPSVPEYPPSPDSLPLVVGVEGIREGDCVGNIVGAEGLSEGLEDADGASDASTAAPR